jgi:serine/threonine-protein kinase
MSYGEASAARSASPIAPGDIVGDRYRVGEVIGEGGMGVVFEATHTGLETEVALKVIRSDLKDDAEFVLRFVNEARTAALLRGEHIARVYDVGTLESGELYLVMERLEGIGLETFLATTGPLDPPQAVRFVLEVCEGLAEAHALSLVHRDIKPANLFLSRRADGRSFLKILDFGIAKRLSEQQRRELTDPARSLGSPWYMSPEQMIDSSQVDLRTDIWALGVLLFELLTGEHPFDGRSIPEVCSNVLNAPAPSVRELRHDVSRGLDAVILRCLDKDPERRFPDVRSLAESLLESLPASASGALRLPRAARFRGARRPTHGSLAPLAGVGFRRSTFSSVLVPVSIVALTGAVTWALFAYGGGRHRPAWSSPLLGRIELPGDPALNPGPVASDSLGALRLPPLPVVVLEVSALDAARSTDAKLPNDATLEANTERAQGAEPTLTPDEIEARARRYETWLRQKGLKRVGDVTTDANNPY